MHNRYHKAKFFLGAHNLTQLPDDQGSEVAFAGRSNCGKSSAINAITGNQRLARISKIPGRTQQLNYYQLDNERRLVDLPGYGYAKVAAKKKSHWRKVLDQYFITRRSLIGLILIMDIRHPLKQGDEQMLHWCHVAGLPVHVLLSKVDKLSKGAAKTRLIEVEEDILGSGVGIQLFSAHRHQGLHEARKVLDKWFDH